MLTRCEPRDSQEALIERPRVRFQSLSNLTTSIVRLTQIGSVPPHKGICNFKIFQLKCFWQFPRFRLGPLILTVPNGSPWVAVCAQRAFTRIQSEFFSNFPWQGNQLLVVKRRLINCPLSCRIAWFLKKHTKALFQDSSILFRAHFQLIESAAAPHRLPDSGTDGLPLLSAFNALVNRADWFVTSCSFNLIDKRQV